MQPLTDNLKDISDTPQMVSNSTVGISDIKVSDSSSASSVTDNRPLTEKCLLTEETRSKYLKDVLMKAGRLTSALYLVSDIMEISEPLKWRLRSAGLDALSLVSFSAETRVSDVANVLNGATKKIQEIASLLEVGLISGTVSSMNYTILKSEYESLLNNLRRAPFLRPVELMVIPPSFLSENSTDNLQENILGVGSGSPKKGGSFSAADSSLRTEIIYKTSNPARGSIGHQKRVSDRTQPLAEGVVDPSTHNVIASPKITAINTRAKKVLSVTIGTDVGAGALESPIVSDKTTTSSGSSNGQNSRHTLISSVLKDNIEYSISDIIKAMSSVANMDDLSTKTVQRDINAMVVANLLSRKGEKRWSRYAKIRI